MIGIHSAKFRNEHETDNIRQAILRHEIEHPVTNDADSEIFVAYGVESWPTLVLIDAEGTRVGMVSGEGHYPALEKNIRNLVDRSRKDGKLNERPLRFALEREKAASRPFAFPGKVLADEKTDHLFIADSNHNRIVISDLKGRFLAAAGSGRVGRADGDYASAAFHHPQGMAWQAPYLYVADTNHHRILVADLSERVLRPLIIDAPLPGAPSRPPSPDRM